MSKLAKQISSKKQGITVEQMREQAMRLKNQSVSKVAKQHK
jgi:hypothetical protein